MVMENNTTTSTVNKSDTDFPPGMAPKMLNMLKTVKKLEETLNPIISKAHHEVFAKLAPLEKSKMGMLESYAINSLFWVLMKTSSEDVDVQLKEDYKLEMNRLKEIQSRIAEVESRAQRPQMNTEVAARLIRRGIGRNNEVAIVEEDCIDYPNKKMRKREKPENCENEAFKRSWQ